MRTPLPSPDQSLRAENAELRKRLEEAEEMLRAIRSGEVDVRMVESNAEQLRSRGELLAQVGDAVVVVDLGDCITFRNAAAEQLYGLQPGEMLGHKLDEVFTRHWPSQEEEAAVWATLREHGQWHGQYLERTAHGRELHVDSSITALRDAHGEIIGHLSAVRNITERKRGEEESREALLLDTLLARAPVGFAYFDRELRYLRINERLAEINGLSAAEHLGRTVEEVVPTMAAEIREVSERMAATGQPALDQEFTGETASAPGFIRHWNVNWFPVHSERGEIVGFGAVVEEITGRKNAEKALQDSERNYRALAIATSEVVYRMSADWSTMLPLDGRELVASSAQSLTDWAWLEQNVPPEEHPRLRQGISKAIARKGLFELEHRVRRPDGSIGWTFSRAVPILNGNGEVTAWFGAASDITERKRTEEALRVSEARFRAAAGAVSSLIRTNNARGEMEGNQPGWGLFTGQSREEYQGYGWAMAVHPEDAQPTLDAWDRAVAEKRMFEFEHRVRRHDGEWRVCEVRAVPVLGEAGEICEWVGVHTDITERQKTEETLRESEAQFRGILRQSPAGIVQTDATGCMTMVNERWCEMLGYSEAELLGKSVLDITHSSSVTATGENVARLAAGGPDFQVEKNYCRKDGSALPAQSNVRALRSAEGQFLGLIAVVLDLTERFLADQQLRDRAGQLDLLARSAQRLFECPSLTPEVREEIFGGIGQLIGVESYFHYRADNAERCLFLDASSGLGEEERRVYGSLKFGEMLCGRVAESGKRLIVEDLPRSTQPGSESLRAAGAQSYAGFPLLDSRGKLVGTLAFASQKRTHFREGDVQMIETICAQVALMMERERAEEALRKQKRFLDRITAVTPDVLYVMDITDFHFKWVSPQAAIRMGYSAEEILAMGADFMPRVMHPDDLARMPAHFAELAQAADGQTLEIDYRLRHPDGSWRWFGGRKTPFTRDADGRVREIIGTSVDITARKRAEAAVARLAAIVESSHDALFGEDLDGIITSWNRGAEQIFGYRAEEIVGTSIMRLMPADRQAEEHQLQQQIAAGEVGGTFEAIRLTKEGREFPASITIAPLKDAAGKVIGTSRVVRDITERTRAEETLRENAAVFRTLISQAPMGTYVLDAQLRMRQINAHAMSAFGSVHPLIGRDFQEVVEILWGPELAGSILRVFRNTLATGEPYISPPFTEKRHDLGIEQTYEWETQRVTLPEGQHGVVCYFHEVTERAQATEALRASQERMRLAAEATGVGIWEWNVVTNAIQWDGVMFEIYGSTPTPDGVVQYRDWSGAVLPEDLEVNAAILQETVRQCGRSTRSFRIRRRSDGECRHIESVEIVRLDAAGQAAVVVGTNLDVTERIEAEQAILQAAEKAVAANLAKDRFLAALSHELRTPLTPVLLVSGVHAKSKKLSEDLREDFAMIHRNVVLEAQLIDDLLDVSRIQQGKMRFDFKPVDVHEAITRALEMLHSEVEEKGIAVRQELHATPAVIEADPTRLRQVLCNLLRNAVKFTPHGGTITVRTAREPGDLKISVIDTGAGIPAEDLQRIFEAFEQVEHQQNSEYRSLGLGLAISASIVAAHRGRIWAESPGRDQGATFHVRFPC